MNKNEKGFGVVEILTVVVMIGLIAAVGWLIWDRQATKKNDSTKPATTDNIQNNETERASVSKLPEGYVQYKNNELEISFAYPNDWGAITVEEGLEMKAQHLLSGSEYLLSFDGNKSVTAGIRSSDWKHDDNVGHGQKGNITGVNYSQQTVDNIRDGFGKVIYKDSMSFVAAVAIGGSGCDGAGHILVKNYNANYSIGFLNYDKAGTRQFEDPICDNYEQYLNPATAETLKKIDSTIKSL